MITQRRKIGDEGEATAAKFLEDRGGEIDLVAEKDDEIIFVEVKTRRTEKFGHPLESITPRKIEKMQIAAWDFLEKNGLTERNFRFDAITILGRVVEHWENIGGDF